MQGSKLQDREPDMERVLLRGADEHRLCGWVRGSGPVRVVFLHGIGDHARVWDAIALALPSDICSLCVDLRGHGDSSWSQHGEYARGDFGRDVEVVLQDLGPAPIALVGHSLGAWLALRYAALHGERLVALALLDVGLRVETSVAQRLREGLVREATSFASLESYLEHVRGRYWLAEPAALEAFARASVRHDDELGVMPKLDPAARSVLRDRDAFGDVWADLRRIACPTLVLRGAGSAVLSRQTAREMVDAHLPNGHLVEVPRAGHALLLDNPSETRRAVLDFLLPQLRSDAACVAEPQVQFDAS